jgi:hypothetical protein
MTEALVGIFAEHRVQQRQAVGAHLSDKHVALGLLTWKARTVPATPISIGPVGLDVLEQPLACLLREYIQRVSDGLAYSLHAIVGADRGQEVRRVRPLAAAGMRPAPLATQREQRIQQLLLCRTCQQASAELAEHAGIESRVAKAGDRARSSNQFFRARHLRLCDPRAVPQIA